MDANVKQKRRWLIEFGLISLVPMILLGIFLSQTLGSQARERAIASARAEARLVSDLALRRVVGDELDPGDAVTSEAQIRARPLGRLDPRRHRHRAPHDPRPHRPHRLGRRPHADRQVEPPVRGQRRAARQLGLEDRGPQQEPALRRTRASAACSRSSSRSAPSPAARPPARPRSGSRTRASPGQVQEHTRIALLRDRLRPALRRGRRSSAWSPAPRSACAARRPRRRSRRSPTALTGLPNRTMFTNLVERTIASNSRRKRTGVVMLMDLDRFKDVNDTLGHHNGDLLLQRIGSRLAQRAARHRDRRPPRRRRVRDPAPRRRRPPVRRAGRPPGAQGARGAGRGRRPRAPVRGLDRHRRVPRARQDRGQRHARGRRGHVHGQGEPLGLRVLRREEPRAPPRRRPPRADRRAAPRDGRDRAGPLLPAQGRHADRPRRGRRGARPLAPPGARPAVARTSSSRSPSARTCCAR